MTERVSLCSIKCPLHLSVNGYISVSALDIKLAYITFSNLKSLFVQPHMFTLPPRFSPLH